MALKTGPNRISDALGGTSVASMHAQALQVGYCFVESSNHAHRSLENRQPRWTNLECRKGSNGPCGPVSASQKRFRSRYLALSVIPDYQPPASLHDLLPVVLHDNFCTAGSTRSLHYTNRIRQNLCAGKLTQEIPKNGCHWVHGFLHRLRKLTSGDQGYRAECAELRVL